MTDWLLKFGEFVFYVGIMFLLGVLLQAIEDSVRWWRWWLK
jgi:hypothetical protein